LDIFEIDQLMPLLSDYIQELEEYYRISDDLRILIICSIELQEYLLKNLGLKI